MSSEILKNEKWPHSPAHIFHENGTYMVTGATLHKKHIFNEPDKLELLQDNLMELADSYHWNLQAWAIFSNHYHFIGFSEKAENLFKFISNFHGRTAYLINKLDKVSGRRVWFQYWDTKLTYQKSHFARLNYVINNPVKHKLAQDPLDYRWCSAACFKKTSPANFVKAVQSFKTDQLDLNDDFFEA